MRKLTSPYSSQNVSSYYYLYGDNKLSVPVFINLMHAAVLTGSDLPWINHNWHDHDFSMHNLLASLICHFGELIVLYIIIPLIIISKIFWFLWHSTVYWYCKRYFDTTLRERYGKNIFDTVDEQFFPG